MFFYKKIALINFLISFLFLFDRLTKWLAFKIPRDGIFLWSKKFIGLHLYKNFNLIFNLKPPLSLMYGLIGVILAVMILFLIKNYQQKKYFLIFCFSLIIVGAISNLIDRLCFGFVVDFIIFFDYSIFNLSDVYIVVGIGLIFIYELYHSKKTVKEI